MMDAITAQPIRDYDGLVLALRARAAELGLTVATIDELSGLPSGYTGKLLGESQVKSIGPMSLGLLLDTLGLELVARPNDETTSRMQGRWEKRLKPPTNAHQVRMKAKDKKFPAVLFKIMSRRAALARKNIPVARRVELARQAANARWGRRETNRKENVRPVKRKAREGGRGKA